MVDDEGNSDFPTLPRVRWRAITAARFENSSVPAMSIINSSMVQHELSQDEMVASLSGSGPGRSE
jgi:hypothetical protein